MEVKNYFATDTQGNVLGSAQVYLYLAGTTTLATGLQNISGAALANPFTSQSNGFVQFKAPDGDYDLRVVKPGREFTIRIQCFDGVAFSAMVNVLFGEISESISDIESQISIERFLAPVRPEEFGGVADNSTDSTEALQAALDTGRPVILSGKYVATSRLTRSGALNLRGYSSDTCGIRWPEGSASAGIDANPTVVTQFINYRDVDLVCEAALPSISLIRSSWAGIAGFNIYSYFTTKFSMIGCMIRCLGAGSCRKIVETEYLYGGLLQHVHLYGAARVGPDSESAYPTEFGFHASNDATTGNTVGIKLYDVHAYYCKEPAWLDDVEGVEVSHCDFQACWNGLTVLNSIRRINQYRISNNHFGCNNTALKVTNARHLLLNSNEFSWGSNRASGANINYIELLGVEDPHIIGNTIRGNSATTTYGHTIYGLVGGPDATSGTLRAIVDDNTFRDITASIVQGTGCIGWNIAPGNNYSNAGQRLINNTAAGTSAGVPMRYGPGPQVNPTGVSPLVLFTNIGASALALNRDVAGSMQTFHVGNGSAAGLISSTTTTTTYGTTSDQTLKDDLGEIPIDEAEAVIKALSLHRWTWKSNGEIDEGFFAQELNKIYPKAVFVGGWRDESGANVQEGTEGAHYEAWAVDPAKLVIPIARCMQGILDRLDAIEGKKDE